VARAAIREENVQSRAYVCGSSLFTNCGIAACEYDQAWQRQMDTWRRGDACVVRFRSLSPCCYRVVRSVKGLSPGLRRRRFLGPRSREHIREGFQTNNGRR